MAMNTAITAALKMIKTEILFRLTETVFNRPAFEGHVK
jgi:hypothetical protein